MNIQRLFQNNNQWRRQLRRHHRNGKAAADPWSGLFPASCFL